MIVIAGFILGAILGILSARRRKGNRLDMLQYGFIHGMILAIIALFLSIAIDRAAG